jgi:hypothetical protein
MVFGKSCLSKGIKMIRQEAYFLLGSFLGGVLVVTAYDVLCLFRKIIPHNRGFINGEDVLFLIGASIFIFKIIYKLNDGTIRGFALLCMVAGVIFIKLFQNNIKKGLKKAEKAFTIKNKKKGKRR